MQTKEKLELLHKRVQHEPEKVKEEAEILLEECRGIGDRSCMFGCYLLLSEVYSHWGDYKGAESQLKEALELAESDQDKGQLGRVHNYLGTIHWYKGEYSEALSEYLQLRDYAEQLSDRKLQFNAYNNIGMIYWIEQDYKRAEETYRKGYKLLEDKQGHDAANVLNNIGLCQLKRGEFAKAEDKLLRALEIFRRENDQKLAANSLLNLANCYIGLEKGEQGIEYVKKALLIKQDLNDRWGICHCSSILARLHLTTEKMAEAEELIEEGVQLAEELEAKPLLQDYYLLGSEYWEKAGDYHKALEYERKSSVLWQEMQELESKEQIRKLQREFELKEKEKETEIFRLKNIELKKKNELIIKQKRELDKTLKKLQILNETLQQTINDKIEQLREKDQMLIMQSRQAAMGEMLANIAHQWRQPLNGISILTQNLTDGWEFEEFNEKFLYSNTQKILDLVKYMNNTISDFRSFLSPDKKADDFNLKETVERTVSFVEYSLKASNIDLKLNLSDVTAYGFPNYYSQVLMNIINNARDVLEERRISEPFIQIKSYKSSKTKRSVLTVEDNAGGINSELLSQIFKPYFTTKSKDKGTGLGLYMSKVLIEKNMKGRLSVKNTSVGACFRIEI